MDETDKAELIARCAENAAEFEALCVEFPSIPDQMRREVAGLPYSTLCPQCGGLLLAVEDQPDTAPWLCDDCHRGFWSAELSGQPCKAIELEQLEAQLRGCSLRPDQLRLLTAGELAAVPGRHLGLHPDFQAAIAAEIERKGRRPLHSRTAPQGTGNRRVTLPSDPSKAGTT